MQQLPHGQFAPFSALVWQYARTVLSFSLTLSFVFGAFVGVLMIDKGFVSPDLSFQAISYVLLGKLPSCLVAFFLLLRLTFVAQFRTQEHQSFEAQMLHPARHMAASVWAALLGWELSMLGAGVGLMCGLLMVDPSEMHAIWAYLSSEYDLTIASRGLLRTILHAMALSWLLHVESIVMAYWQSDKETRMTQFIFLGLLALISVEIVDTVLFLN